MTSNVLRTSDTEESFPGPNSRAEVSVSDLKDWTTRLLIYTVFRIWNTGRPGLYRSYNLSPIDPFHEPGKDAHQRLLVQQSARKLQRFLPQGASPTLAGWDGRAQVACTKI